MLIVRSLARPGCTYWNFHTIKNSGLTPGINLKKKNQRVLMVRIVPVVLWAVLIFAFSSNPNPYRPLPDSWVGPPNPDPSAPPSKAEILGRFLHVGEYLVLAALTANVFNWEEKPKRLLIPAVLGFTTLYGLSDEVHQLFIPNRAFQWTDLGLDVLGAILGITLFIVIRSIREKRRNQYY
jgi:VanZ family protein